jgi:hypothetical protein
MAAQIPSSPQPSPPSFLQERETVTSFCISKVKSVADSILRPIINPVSDLYHSCSDAVHGVSSAFSTINYIVEKAQKEMSPLVAKVVATVSSLVQTPNDVPEFGALHNVQACEKGRQESVSTETLINKIKSNEDCDFDIEDISDKDEKVKQQLTNTLKEKFTKEVCYYTLANVLHNKTSDKTLPDDTEYIRFVNDLMEYEKKYKKRPKFLTIINIFLKHFKECGWISVTFCYLFYGIPLRFYIQKSMDKVVQSIRGYVNQDTTQKTNNLSKAIADLVNILSSFLENYNRIVKKFAETTEGEDKSSYIAAKLIPAEKKLYKSFAKTFTSRFVPDFDYISSIFRNIRTVEFIKKDNFLIRFVKGIVQVVLYPLVFWEWLLGSLPTKIIKWYCAKLIEEQTPILLKKGFAESIERKSFNFAIKSSIYQLFENINEKINQPYDPKKEDPDQTTDKLRTTLGDLTKHLIQTLTVPGREKSPLEKLVEILGLINTDKQIQDAIQKGLLISSYNYLSNPKRAEPYLALILKLLSSIFDNTEKKPDLHSMENKLSQEKNKFFAFIINQTVSKEVDSYFGILSSDQKRKIGALYDKLKDHVNKVLPKLHDNSEKISLSLNVAQGLLNIEELKKLLKETNINIEKISNFIINISPEQNSLDRKFFEKGLKEFNEKNRELALSCNRLIEHTKQLEKLQKANAALAQIEKKRTEINQEFEMLNRLLANLKEINLQLEGLDTIENSSKFKPTTTNVEKTHQLLNDLTPFIPQLQNLTQDGLTSFESTILKQIKDAISNMLKPIVDDYYNGATRLITDPIFITGLTKHAMRHLTSKA